LGIFLYELLIGQPPFMASDPCKIFEMTLNQQLKFTKNFDSDAKSLIKKLCNHDLSKRYGNMKNGASDVLNHKFFKNFDFKALE